MNSFMFVGANILLLLSGFSNASDSITQSQTISEGKALASLSCTGTDTVSYLIQVQVRLYIIF